MVHCSTYEIVMQKKQLEFLLEEELKLKKYVLTFWFKN